MKGDSNQIHVGSTQLNLQGSNHTLSAGLNSTFTITASSGTLSGDRNELVLKGGVVPGGATLTGGVLSVQLGNGNVATFGSVTSGTQIEYVDVSGAATWTTLVDTGASTCS